MLSTMNSRAAFLAWASPAIWFLIVASACSLTSAQRASLAATTEVLCEALIPLAGAPHGVDPAAFDAAVCRGSEAILGAALAAVAPSAPPAPATKPPPGVVYADGARRRWAGVVRGDVAPQVQRAIDEGVGR